MSLRRNAVRGWRVGLAVLAALTLAPAGPAGAQQGVTEYAVKAAFLFKFAPFVTWAPGDFESPNSPLVICVAGDDPFGAVLDQAVGGQRIDQRPILVRRARTIDRQTGCHVAYVGGSQAQPVAQALGALRGAHVLTVTDASNGVERGVVHFVVANNRIRFHVDDQAAAQNGLAISSKLLSLALSVRPRAQERRQ